MSGERLSGFEPSQQDLEKTYAHSRAGRIVGYGLTAAGLAGMTASTIFGSPEGLILGILSSGIGSAIADGEGASMNEITSKIHESYTRFTSKKGEK